MFIKGHISGIYKIICLGNGKSYIGSSINIAQRFKRHKNRLRKNKHNNPYLQKSWNKYGENNFKFQIIENMNSNSLIEKELFWINKFDTFDRKYGFNIVKPQTPPMTGRLHSIKSKSKMSKAHRGKILTDKHKNNIRNYRIGQKQTEETKQKIGLSHRGKIVSMKTIKNMRKAQRRINRRGSKNPKTFITEEIVKNIRLDYKNGIKPKYLIIKYNLKRSHIKKIISNQIWRHI